MKCHLQSLLPLGLASVAVMGIPLLGTSAQAAESIVVRYQDTEVNVTRQELNNFTDTGELPSSLQTLFNTDAELPKVVRTLLSDQLTVPTFMKNFIQGTNGEFLLFKLDQVISSADGKTERGLNSLKTAVLDSIADDRVSFLEIIDKHPQNTIRLDITSLEGTYNDISKFVERILPALEVAKDVLSDFICDCDTAQESSESPTTQPGSNQRYQSDQALGKCRKRGSTIATTEPNSFDTSLPNLLVDPSRSKSGVTLTVMPPQSATQTLVTIPPAQ